MALIITFGIVIGLLLYLVVIQYSRASKLEDIANSLALQLENISSIIDNAQESLDNPRLVQAFSGDDEVGIFFQQIKDIQKELNQFSINNGTSEETSQ